MPFQPSDLTGYQWGVDAASAFTDTSVTTPSVNSGDAVKSMSDQSGNGRHLVWQASNVPQFVNVNGRKSVYFASPIMETSAFLDTSYNTAFTLYACYEWLDRNSLEVFFSIGGTQLFVADDAGTTQTARYDWFTNGNGLRNLNWPLDNKLIVALRYDGTTKKFRLVPFNNSGDATLNSSASFSLGLNGDKITMGQLTGGGFGWRGWLYGAYLYNSAHSDANTDSMVAYLMSRHATPSRSVGTTGAGNTVVICDGDSLTAGVGSTGGQSYPTQLGTLLGGTYTITNLGVTGQSAGEVRADAEQSGQVDPSYLSTAKENIYVLWAGTNDLHYGYAPEQAIGRLKDNVNWRLANGWQRVIIVSVLSRGSTVANFDTLRATINSALSSFASGDLRVQFVNLTADPNIGPDGSWSNTTYFAGDNTHLNNTGYAIVAGLVEAAILNPPTPPSTATDFTAKLGPQHPLRLASSLPVQPMRPAAAVMPFALTLPLPPSSVAPAGSGPATLSASQVFAPPFPNSITIGPWYASQFVPLRVEERQHFLAPVPQPRDVQTPPLTSQTIIPGPWNRFGKAHSILPGIGPNAPVSPPPGPPPPPPPPESGVIGPPRNGVASVPRDPEADIRSRAHIDKVTSLLNSLLRRGFIVLRPNGEFDILGGGIVLPRAPVVTDDASLGAVVGGTFIDTLHNDVYICTNNSIGSAVWRKITLS